MIMFVLWAIWQRASLQPGIVVSEQGLPTELLEKYHMR